jgi:palmitoyltransferase
MLVDNGADILAKNQYGLNVMHIAAQGDQPISLFYFKQLGVDLTSRDNRNSTPLHWACFQNSEIALIYLLGWLSKSRLQMQDVDGYTPLHLAVKSSEQLKSGRPMRALLMRGADRNIRENKGKLPIDLVEDIKNEVL